MKDQEGGDREGERVWGGWMHACPPRRSAAEWVQEQEEAEEEGGKRVYTGEGEDRSCCV